jgi:hypothetical protein
MPRPAPNLHPPLLGILARFSQPWVSWFASVANPSVYALYQANTSASTVATSSTSILPAGAGSFSIPTGGDNAYRYKLTATGSINNNSSVNNELVTLSIVVGTNTTTSTIAASPGVYAWNLDATISYTGGVATVTGTAVAAGASGFQIFSISGSWSTTATNMDLRANTAGAAGTPAWSVTCNNVTLIQMKVDQ